MNCKSALIVLLGVLCPTVARASDIYTEEIERRYGVPLPECVLCHKNNKGLEGTVIQFFGRQVIAHGAEGDNLPSFLNALAQMEKLGRASDADGDGWGDIEELQNRTNPNDFYDPPEAPPTGATSGSGGTGTETATTGSSSGGNAGAGELESATVTTGATRPRRPPPPSAELPPQLETGCHFGAVPLERAPWALPALLVGAVLLRRRPKRR